MQSLNRADERHVYSTLYILRTRATANGAGSVGASAEGRCAAAGGGASDLAGGGAGASAGGGAGVGSSFILLRFTSTKTTSCLAKQHSSFLLHSHCILIRFTYTKTTSYLAKQHSSFLLHSPCILLSPSISLSISPCILNPCLSIRIPCPCHSRLIIRSLILTPPTPCTCILSRLLLLTASLTLISPSLIRSLGLGWGLKPFVWPQPSPCLAPVPASSVAAASASFFVFSFSYAN